jgi:Tfp pilus assembly protein PilF
LFPSPTMPEYSIHSLLVWKSLSALILLFCILFILWTKVLKSEKSRWLLVWFLFGLIPVADLSGMGLRFSDQLIYIASAPFAILVGQFVDKYSLKIKMMTAIFLLVCICLAQQQLKIWRNSEKLWSYALSLEPNNIMANINYANGLAQIGKEKESCAHSYKTLVLTLNNPVAFDQQLLVYNLGVCFENTHPAVAEKYYRAAVDISREQHWASLHNLGLLLYKRGELNEAHEIATKLVRNFPGVYFSWKLMGLVQQGKGLSKQSSESFQTALSLNSTDPDLIRLTQSIK